jgi:hypothetical protein
MLLVGFLDRFVSVSLEYIYATRPLVLKFRPMS